MNSSDGISSNVGVVPFATVENKATLQVIMREQEDTTERSSPFHPSNMSASYVAADVAVAAVVASMLNITFFMMIEKNAYIVIAPLMDGWIQFLLEQDGVFLAMDVWSFESIGRRKRFCSARARSSRMSHGPCLSYESVTDVLI
jgi:hypothetical protein